MIRVAINGFGRIGRIALRQMLTMSEFDVVAINTGSSDTKTLAHLLKYDTVHGLYHADEISSDEENIILKGVKKIKCLSIKEPENIPWKDLNVDLVLECSGKFTKKEDLQKHLNAGAKKVLLSAPGKDEIKTIVYGVNENTLSNDDVIVSTASCTTNCLAPLLKIIDDNYGINKGFMSTIHSYTSDQNVLDNSHKKGIESRRGRAAAENIAIATTGAAKSIGIVIPSLNGKMDGIAYRVPTADGSVVDTVLELKKNTTKEEINKMFENNQNETIKITYDPIVSCDIIGSKLGSLIDGLSTNVIESDGKQLVKIVAWYDNEWGYTAQMLRVAKKMF